MKPIKLNDAAKTEALERFRKMIEEYQGDSDLTIKITPESLLTNNNDIVKPTVFVTIEAYLRMTLLINQSSDELAWHGVVHKLDNNYLIENILVYPQEVTGTTVDADEVKYAQWLMELPDNVINNLRFQGHSHVNMSTSPSGRDTSNWQKFLNLLQPGEFYIFCIANKKGEYHWVIYDTEKNVMFENKDITMKVVDADNNCITDWVSANIEQYITRKSYVGFSNNSTTFRSTCPSSVNTVSNKSNNKTAESKNPFNHFVPTALKHLDVNYEPDMDMYYSDTYTPGFIYSSTWGCYIAEGEAIREKYGNPVKPKRGPGRPKKEKSEQTKKGK